jgi:hypothetical protein
MPIVSRIDATPDDAPSECRVGQVRCAEPSKVTPTGGTATTAAYFKSGSATSADTFTVGQADTNGNAA